MKDYNSAVLSGLVVENPKYSHVMGGTTYYKMFVKADRRRDGSDIIPVTFSDEVFDPNADYEGEYVEIAGSFESYSKAYGGKRRLILSLHANYISEVACGNENSVTINGYLTKKVNARLTAKSKMRIADMMIAVNNEDGSASYIPCIAWGANADYAETLNTGAYVHLSGRMQSRTYFKKRGDGTTEERTAYEVSVGGNFYEREREN